MPALEFCKLQTGCLLIILYIVFVYWKECRRFGQKHRWSVFEGLLGLGILEIIFDGMTAYTVNHLDSVNRIVNLGLHLMFLLSLDFLYLYCFFT